MPFSVAHASNHEPTFIPTEPLQIGDTVVSSTHSIPFQIQERAVTHPHCPFYTIQLAQESKVITCPAYQKPLGIESWRDVNTSTFGVCSYEACSDTGECAVQENTVYVQHDYADEAIDDGTGFHLGSAMDSCWAHYSEANHTAAFCSEIMNRRWNERATKHLDVHLICIGCCIMHESSYLYCLLSSFSSSDVRDGDAVLLLQLVD